MEFNVFEYFKGYKRTTSGPMTPEEQGSSFFLAGHMGERIREHVDGYAAKAGLSRRGFLGTASGFAAVMLAVNKITGMRFFEVSEAEAYDPVAAKEITVTRKPGADFIVDAHTHICTRKDGYIPGVNTTEKGMWFVQLLDDLGKAMGLPNGTKDMTVENFGKLILEGSDTSVAVFNPFGFREDYGGKDMIPIEEQAEVKQRWPDRTVMLGGGLTPNQGLGETLDRLQLFVETYKISGLKLYTFDSTPARGWWFDDQKMAYPIWEKCRKLGVKNIGCHKGIPFGQFMARYAHPEDLDAAADDFRDLNFIAYHSAWPYQHELAALEGIQAPAEQPVFRGWLDLRGDRDESAARVRARARHAAPRSGSGLRDVGDRLRAVGKPPVADRRLPEVPDPRPARGGLRLPEADAREIKAKVFGLNAARIWNLKTTASALPAEPRRIAAV